MNKKFENPKLNKKRGENLQKIEFKLVHQLMLAVYSDKIVTI
jgi:hypothetical protein